MRFSDVSHPDQGECCWGLDDLNQVYECSYEYSQCLDMRLEKKSGLTAYRATLPFLSGRNQHSNGIGLAAQVSKTIPVSRSKDQSGACGVLATAQAGDLRCASHAVP